MPNSNPPPGVSASDIDRAYGPAIPDHDHEWAPAGRPNEPSFILEDGAAIFQYDCVWVEITDTHHGPKRDEIYEETGAECGETHDIRLETDANEAALETIELAFTDDNVATKDLVEYIDPPNPDRSEGKLIIEHDGTRVTYKSQ